MNALTPFLLPVHFRIINGSHTVLLCNPSILGTPANSVPKRSMVTCSACKTALAEDDHNEIIKRMNSK